MKKIKKLFLFTCVLICTLTAFGATGLAQTAKSDIETKTDQASNSKKTVQTPQSNEYSALVYNDEGVSDASQPVATTDEGYKWIKSKGLRGMVIANTNPKKVLGVELEGDAIDFKSNFLIKDSYAKSKYDEKVAAIQKVLNLLGYKVKVDGYYGSNTVSIVKEFQKAEHLNSDGIIGENTYEKLITASKSK